LLWPPGVVAGTFARNARASSATRYGWHCCLADKFGALDRGAVTDGRSLRAGGPGDQPGEGGADEHCLHCRELTGLPGHALLLRFEPGPMPGVHVGEAKGRGVGGDVPTVTPASVDT